MHGEEITGYAGCYFFFMLELAHSYILRFTLERTAIDYSRQPSSIPRRKLVVWLRAPIVAVPSRKITWRCFPTPLTRSNTGQELLNDKSLWQHKNSSGSPSHKGLSSPWMAISSSPAFAHLIRKEGSCGSCRSYQTDRCRRRGKCSRHH